MHIVIQTRTPLTNAKQTTIAKLSEPHPIEEKNDCRFRSQKRLCNTIFHFFCQIRRHCGQKIIPSSQLLDLRKTTTFTHHTPKLLLHLPLFQIPHQRSDSTWLCVCRCTLVFQQCLSCALVIQIPMEIVIQPLLSKTNQFTQPDQKRGSKKIWI